MESSHTETDVVSCFYETRAMRKEKPFLAEDCATFKLVNCWVAIKAAGQVPLFLLHKLVEIHLLLHLGRSAKPSYLFMQDNVRTALPILANCCDRSDVYLGNKYDSIFRLPSVALRATPLSLLGRRVRTFSARPSKAIWNVLVLNNNVVSLNRYQRHHGGYVNGSLGTG